MKLNDKAKYTQIAMSVTDLEDITDKLVAMGQTAGNHILPPGNYKITRTIYLSSHCHIQGSGNLDTVLVLDNDVNANMFMASSYLEKGKINSDIKLKNLQLNCNRTAQRRPESEKRLSFCNAVYLSDSQDCLFEDLIIENVMQTSLHFRGCDRVTISNFYTQDLGWSGISTSGTNNIKATDFNIYNSGNDHRHSAIHLDGGKFAYIRGTVEKCVGNGVMLDSTFGPFSNAVVEVSARTCMRGVSLIGSGEVQTRGVAVVDSHLSDNEIGIMVSNSYDAFIINCQINRNREYGVLFQGRAGGCDSFVKGCQFSENGLDIGHIHESKNNTIIDNIFSGSKING